MRARRGRALLVLRLAGRPAPARAAAGGRGRRAGRADPRRSTRQTRTQGAPRITAELNDGVAAERAGQPQAGRPGDARARHRRLRLRRRVRTTIPEPADQKVPDLLDRDFTAPAPNQRYVGDITYLPLADGTNLYLATVIDCYSRRLAGWAIADHMRTELVDRRAHRRRRDPGLAWPGRSSTPTTAPIYTSKDFAQLCAELGVTQSMGAVGTSADNALAESFNATLKREIAPRRARLARRGHLPPRRCSGG